MRSRAVVVLLIRGQHVTQMQLAKHDHMIQAFASDRADQSFGIAVLPHSLGERSIRRLDAR